MKTQSSLPKIVALAIFIAIVGAVLTIIIIWT